MPRLPYDPDEEASAALSWALARQVRHLHSPATSDLLIETSLAVFCGVLPAWSAEVGAPLVEAEERWMRRPCASGVRARTKAGQTL